MLLRELFHRLIPAIFEGGNLSSHDITGKPTVGYTQGVPGTHVAEKIDAENRSAMVPVVKQLLVDINNTFARQYGRHIWSPELIEKEVHTFISGSSKWFMFLRQPNPSFDPRQPESENNPKEIGITDEQFRRVKKKVGDIDTQIDRRLEPQLTEFLQKNNGKNIGSATLIGYKKGSDQWLAHWRIHEPPITLQVDLEFVDYTTDSRGFEIPTEWAQVSHGSEIEDLNESIKGVFRQWLYRSLAKVPPSSEDKANSKEKYIAKVTGAGKNKAMRVFGGDDGKEHVTDFDNPPPPFQDSNFTFAVASVGGGGVRAKYRAPNDNEPVPKEIKGIPVVVPLKPEESNYIKDMSQQFEQFFGTLPTGNERQLMRSLVGTVTLMKTHMNAEQHHVAVQEFIKLCFGPDAQMIDADDPEADFETKMPAIDYLLDHLGMKNHRGSVLQLADQYEKAYHAKSKKAQPLAEAEVVQSKRKGIVHLEKMKDLDFLDLLAELKDKTGKITLDNVSMNVKVDGFGARLGMDAQGRPYAETSRSGPKFEPGQFTAFAKAKGATPESLEESKQWDQWWDQMIAVTNALAEQINLADTKVHVEVLYLPFAEAQPDGRLKFVGIHYDRFPEDVNMVLVPLFAEQSSTGQHHPNSDQIIEAMKKIQQVGSTRIVDNRLKTKGSIDATAIIAPMQNIKTLRAKLLSKDKGVNDRKKEVSATLQPIKDELAQFIITHPNIVGKDILGKDYEGIVINTSQGPVKITSPEQRKVIADKNAALAAAGESRKQAGRAVRTRTAVVTAGSFVGHKGHQQLVDLVLEKAREVGGDPFVYISPVVGPDDPIPPALKLATWQKLYPNLANIFQVWQEGGTPVKKIEKELVLPPNSPYKHIILMVGSDRYAGMKKWMDTLSKRMKDPRYPGSHNDVTFDTIETKRDEASGGTGISFTDARKALAHGDEHALKYWEKAFDVNTLGVPWIKKLMAVTAQNMGIAKQHPGHAQHQGHNPIKEANAIIRAHKRKLAEQLNAFGHPYKDAPLETHNQEQGAYEYGSGREHLHPEQDKVMRDAIGVEDMNFYELYRLGMSLAGGQRNVAGKGHFGQAPLIMPYSKDELPAVMSTVSKHGFKADKLSTSKSEEPETNNRNSVVNKPKKNKYGI